MLTHNKLREAAIELAKSGESFLVISTRQALELCEAHDTREADLNSMTQKAAKLSAENERLKAVTSTDRRTLLEERHHNRAYRNMCEAFMLAFYEEADARSEWSSKCTPESWERWAKAREALQTELQKMLEATRAHAQVMP